MTPEEKLISGAGKNRPPMMSRDCLKWRTCTKKSALKFTWSLLMLQMRKAAPVVWSYRRISLRPSTLARR